MIIDFKNKYIKRIKKESEIKIDFLNEMCTIIDNNLKVNLKIKVIEINIKDNNFLVKYKIENDYFKIEIKII